MGGQLLSHLLAQFSFIIQLRACYKSTVKPYMSCLHTVRYMFKDTVAVLVVDETDDMQWMDGLGFTAF